MKWALEAIGIGAAFGIAQIALTLILVKLGDLVRR